MDPISRRPPPSLLALPDECQEIIVLHLDLFSLANLGSTSARFRRIATERRKRSPAPTPAAVITALPHAPNRLTACVLVFETAVSQRWSLPQLRPVLAAMEAMRLVEPGPYDPDNHLHSVFFMPDATTCSFPWHLHIEFSGNPHEPLAIFGFCAPTAIAFPYSGVREQFSHMMSLHFQNSPYPPELMLTSSDTAHLHECLAYLATCRPLVVMRAEMTLGGRKFNSLVTGPGFAIGW